MRFRSAILACLPCAVLLSACGQSNDAALQLAFIEQPDAMFAEGVRLSPGGQHVRAATRSGLVALNRNGDAIPALADRWNVIDDGRIFVFRLRDGTWPDGQEMTADSVRRALEASIRQLRGTSLALDLQPIDDIRAMAGRVIEIRLASAMPDLLQLLAQPELALSRGEGETGDMSLVREEDVALLAMKPPPERGLPQEERWSEFVRPIALHALAAPEALASFDEGEMDMVLGGRLDAWPLVDTGPLSRGTVRLDPAIGLFGLQARRAQGLLETAELREAISMAIDRPALASRFNIGGWVPTTRVVTPGLPADSGTIGERWVDQSVAARRERAAARVAAWLGSGDGADDRREAVLTIALGEGPGLDLLLAELQEQLRDIGVTLQRAQSIDAADLVLVDTVARYADARWYLNQFNCGLDRGLCSEDADYLVAQALDETQPARRALLLAEAESDLTQTNAYIPFGSPIRWSLVRGSVAGYAANRWAFHPLPEMAVIPR